MITDDEVMRVLERADPARVDDAISPPDGADYFDALRTKSTTATLIDIEPTPTRRHRRRVVVAIGVAAAVVAITALLVPAVSRDTSEPARPAIPPTTRPSTTTGSWLMRCRSRSSRACRAESMGFTVTTARRM